jgi:hypothetical protein
MHQQPLANTRRRLLRCQVTRAFAQAERVEASSYRARGDQDDLDAASSTLRQRSHQLSNGRLLDASALCRE